ncbi:arylsulfatase [Bacteroidota bacterium]
MIKSLNLKSFSIFSVLIFIILSCDPKRSDQEIESSQPNIVIVLTDDQGWGDLSINGNTNLSTPNIDALAQNGASFDRFYVCPVCSPTRAELLTGRYHLRGGVYSTSAGGERLDLDETTIAEVFKNAGYATAAFGKWHNGMQPPYHPNTRGFDEYYGFCSGHWGNYFSPILEHNGQLVNGNGFIIDDFTDKAIEFIKKNKDNPFFVYLPYNTPHSPMQVPDNWWEKFEDKGLEMLNRDPEKENKQHTKAALAMCENIDWNVGRLINKLRELDLEENTIFIYFTDNGPNGWRWNGDMKGRKGSTDEGGVRVPMYIQWPGVIAKGKNIHEISSAIDLLPTLAELAGIDCTTQKPLDGLSIKTLLLEEEYTWDERFVYNHWRGRTSVRDQQYRLDHQNNLFDMIKDPGQRVDISGKNPEAAQKMIQAKEKWEADVLSELPEQDTRSFPVGHPDFKFTQIPARDGIVSGNIKRSNRWPNCSFYTNWTSVEDEISWDVEVLKEGEYNVTVYYTCPEEDIGSTFALGFKSNRLTGKITEAHNPLLTGMEHDRVERGESYVKDFKPLNLGTIYLEKGYGKLSLKAIEIPGSQVMDFRLMMFERID